MAFLGIDLGTTFSAVAYLDARGVPVTIPNAEGELTTPSVVLFEPGGDVIVGREARRAALAEPHRVAEDVKRSMGDPYYPRVINGKQLTPVAVSALILKKLKQDAERKVGKAGGAVITVPAYFDEARRHATAEAARLAGLNVLDIMNEPTSAALAYAFQGLSDNDAREGRTPQEVRRALADTPPRVAVVYDLGGGTFDVTVIRMHGADLTVLATAGDVRLGGRDWDERLFRLMADQFLRLHGLDPRDNPVSTQAIMLAAEETKKVLSLRKQAMYVVNHAGRSYTGEVTREEFDILTEDLLYRTESRLTRVVAQAGMTWQQVDQVLLVGGSTRMPQVQMMLQRVTGREPDTSLSPDEAVAHGAAIHAAACAVKQADQAAPERRTAATPPPLPRPAPPVAPGQDPAKDKPADAHRPPGTAPAAMPPPGAPPVPVPAEELKPESAGLLRLFRDRVIDLLRSLRTVNVNAHSLGVVATTQDGRQRVSVLVPHNTQLPVSVTKRFGTVSENQRGVTVRVVEGESSQVEECLPVGLCRIEQLPAGLPRGSPIDVTFTYDNSGRLHVKASEVKSGNWATVLIQRRSGATRPRAEVEAEEQVAKAPVS